MTRVWMFALTVCICAVQLSAQRLDPTTKSVADSSWIVRSGELQTMLVVTANPQKFVDEWYTSRGEMPKIQRVKTARRGDILGAFVIFGGLGQEGTIPRASVNISIYAPDGSVYGELKGITLWKDPLPSKSLFLLSNAGMQVGLEQKDQLGSYRVVATISGASLSQPVSMESTFTVTE